MPGLIVLGAVCVVALIALTASRPGSPSVKEGAVVVPSPAVSEAQTVSPEDGVTVDLEAGYVEKEIGGVKNRMMAYNGSIPGPTFRVKQGAALTVRFRNGLDEPTTVHWHGLRVANENDGVAKMAGVHGHDDAALPDPVAPGETFTYVLRFPDPGAYWYHPHVREDKQQDLGLYGNIIVEPADAAYWPAADREASLILDDILASDGWLAPHYDDAVDHAIMGRYGNVFLTNGAEDARLAAATGETVRLYVTNVANARPFNLTIPGAAVILVGSDGGRLAEQRVVQSVVLGPSERAVLHVVFPQAGEYPIMHVTPEKERRLGAFTVTEGAGAASLPVSGSDDFTAIRRHMDIPVDATWEFDVAMSHKMEMPHGATDGIEWEDDMPMMNAHMTDKTTTWKFIDQATGAENMGIVTRWKTGEYRKLRLVNPADGDHPMQHPFHLHGQRFVVAATNDAPNANLAWKDTVLVPAGTTMDIVVEVTNPGTWMAHCHIAEHLGAGMMTMIVVEGEDLVADTP